MNNTNKKTINAHYEELIEIIKNADISEELKKEKTAFLEKRIEVNAKKNASGGSKKLTPNQIANKGIAKAIYEALLNGNKELTITEMIKTITECEGLTNQKINGIVSKLYDSEKYPNSNPMFIRSEKKGVAYFKANPDYEIEVEETEGE